MDEPFRIISTLGDHFCETLWTNISVFGKKSANFQGLSCFSPWDLCAVCLDLIIKPFFVFIFIIIWSLSLFYHRLQISISIFFQFSLFDVSQHWQSCYRATNYSWIIIHFCVVSVSVSILASTSSSIPFYVSLSLKSKNNFLDSWN